jgi:hypothetical protein
MGSAVVSDFDRRLSANVLARIDHRAIAGFEERLETWPNRRDPGSSYGGCVARLQG